MTHPTPWSLGEDAAGSRWITAADGFRVASVSAMADGDAELIVASVNAVPAAQAKDGMTRRDPAEKRALLALYRNHPSTPADTRYTRRAYRAATEQREMLLAWAATQPDYRLLYCRNLGPKALAWIRANQPAQPAPAAPVDLRIECDRLADALWAVFIERGDPEAASVASILRHYATTLILRDEETDHD